MDEFNRDRRWYLVAGQAYVPLSDEEVRMTQQAGYSVTREDPPWVLQQVNCREAIEHQGAKSTDYRRK